MARKFLICGFVFLLLWAVNGFGQLKTPPTISSITVEPQPDHPGAVRLYWIDDYIPHVDGFNIYRYVFDIHNQGFDSIGTVRFPGDSFLDLDANANEHSESYVIQAFRDTDYQLSPKSDTSFTMYLNKIKLDICSQTDTLKWTPYIGWAENGVNHYEIYRNDLLQEQTPEITFSQPIGLDTKYTYFIKAISNNNDTSESNRVDTTFASFIKPNYDSLYINQVINKGNGVEIKAQVDTSADLIGHQLYFSNSLDFTAFDALPLVKDLSSESLSFTHSYNDSKYYYKVSAIDNCNQIAGETQRAMPLQLKVKRADNIITLTWNSSFVDNSEMYNVFVDINGIPKPPISSDLLVNNIDYDLGEADPTSENFCFWVVATDTKSNVSTSQTECVSRTPKVYIPEAFSPNGDNINDNFGPFVNSGVPENSYIKDVSVTDFKLYIYDRYGGVVFYSDNSKLSWDGKLNGKPVSEGGYPFYYTYTTQSGKSYKGSGAINVVYP